jgi:hypothetical protein
MVLHCCKCLSAVAEPALGTSVNDSPGPKVAQEEEPPSKGSNRLARQFDAQALANFALVYFGNHFSQYRIVSYIQMQRVVR